MISISININDDINIKDLCGLSKPITFFSNSLYKLEPTEEFNNIDEVCSKYNVNKFYHRGMPQNRIVQCCVIPAIIIYINAKYKGYIIVNDTYGKNLLEWDIVCNGGHNNYKYILFDNPIEAAKDYYINMFNYHKNQIDKNKQEAFDWHNNKNILIEEKRKQLLNKYMGIIESEINNYISEKEIKYNQYITSANQHNRFINNNKEISEKLNIDLTEYLEDLP